MDAILDFLRDSWYWILIAIAAIIIRSSAAVLPSIFRRLSGLTSWICA